MLLLAQAKLPCLNSPCFENFIKPTRTKTSSLSAWLRRKLYAQKEWKIGPSVFHRWVWSLQKLLEICSIVGLLLKRLLWLLLLSKSLIARCLPPFSGLCTDWCLLAMSRAWRQQSKLFDAIRLVCIDVGLHRLLRECPTDLCISRRYTVWMMELEAQP